MRSIGSNKGFTLLEILIVLVILAVLAGLAIPAYSVAVEKSRSQEALGTITSIKESLLRQHAVQGTYANATFTVNQPGTLDYLPPTAGGINAATGQDVLFTYALGNLGAATFTITATRVAGANTPIVGGGGTIAMNQAGVVTRTGVYQ